ncbi:MAG: MBL fold metallo-hydrolase [Candidatus Nealsonbacteria bacterium]|nr:MBL fold metallo-hydrolase [Candidatus Nealsonbacteria bacterium]
MHIVWKGQACFQITASISKEEKVNIVIDPFDESIGLRVPNLEAQILLSTHDHRDHNNIKAASGEYFLIKGPGEYERKEVFVRGIPSYHDSEGGAKRGPNTIYTIKAEDLVLCHLGDIGQKELSPEQIDEIGSVDVLMVPVGGVFTVDGKEAAHIVSQIEPSIVIPIHYKIPKLKIGLEGPDKFLKAMGAKSLLPEPKLIIKKKDIQEEETKVVLLEP